jgi:hypothetical protein
MSSRLIAVVIGIFYVITGVWAFLDPASFAGSVATFPPFNRHLLHDAGAFSTGLGLVLLLSAWISDRLLPALLAVLAASLLHVMAHAEDIGLGGRPSTDIPVLSLICVALLAGVALEMRRRLSAGAREAGQ